MGENRPKATDEQIISAYLETGNIWKAGKMLGMCGQSIHERLIKLGIARNLNHFTEYEKDTVCNYYKNTPDELFNQEDLLKLLPEGTTRSRLEHIVTKTGVGRKHKTVGIAHRERQSAARKGIRPPHDGFSGFHHSDTSKRKISASSKEMWQDPNFTQNTAVGKIAHAERARLNGRKVLNSPNAYSRCKRGHYDIPGVGSVYFRSKWEANYALYLQFLVNHREIDSWQYEPKAFEFPVRSGTVFYTPDFMVQKNDGSTEWHEVKGWMDSKSKTKIARMRRFYPQEKLIVIGEKEYRGLKRNAALLGWY